LTLVLQEPPDTPFGSPPELNFPGTGLHTSFRLSAGGEILLLSDSSGNLVDSVSFGPVPGDISFGRKHGDPGKWLYFEQPTPGAQNGATGIENITEGEVSFSPSVKFFEGTISVSLSGDPADGIIRYTTDGSEPDENDTEYSGAIEVSTTTIFRARIFKEGQLPGKVCSYNYIDLDDIDADNIPVISISTDPDNLYNDSDGLFENAENRELEKPAHVEFIEPDGSVGFSIDAGLKIFGNEPRSGDHQHKLAIFARSKYGYGSIDYHLFPDKPIEEFESLILRNEIPDLWDVMASRLIDEEAVANQSYRPSIVFINGEYWGTKFIREKINEHFVASNFGVHPDSVDVIMGIESPVELYNEDWPIAGD
ncbi:MAG: chitobiase/beta-hexosaminidase C-terminal domain-containing protein, partial [Bacteroidales bacterium]|nr:chitobiase/beta-hexosaminidase C-terminal domain-containing protein [Bacteroidales bacterium]